MPKTHLTPAPTGGREDEADGEPVGPVWLSPVTTPTNHWVTLAQAQVIAKALGLQLEEE
jgi:hypothetical protein